MKRFTSPLLLAACLLIGGFPGQRKAVAEESLWQSLTRAQRAELEAGKPVLTEEEVQGSAWPRFRVYQLVKAPPKSVAAVFWDCSDDPQYIPNCRSVKILSRPEPGLLEAEYTLSMPFLLPDEIYVSRNRLTPPADGTYAISWSLLKSRYTLSGEGDLLIEEHDGKALLRYRNLVVPAGRFASLLRGTAGGEVVGSVRALAARVEWELSSSPLRLRKQEEALDHDLSGAH